MGIMSPCVQATGPPGEKLLEYEPQGQSVGLGMRLGQRCGLLASGGAPEGVLEALGGWGSG